MMCTEITLCANNYMYLKMVATEKCGSAVCIRDGKSYYNAAEDVYAERNIYIFLIEKNYSTPLDGNETIILMLWQHDPIRLKTTLWYREEWCCTI